MNTISAIEHLRSILEKAVFPFKNFDHEFCEEISNLIGDAHVVLMGEATHGTEEFYQARMVLSEFLIKEKGFSAIAIEGDWTSVSEIQNYLQGHGNATQPLQALHAFQRFPTWMWRNTAMIKFLKKLRQQNDRQPTEKKVNVYGLDLYCLHDAMQAIIHYLKINHPEYVEKATRRYACFDDAEFDPKIYSYFVDQHLKKSCVKEVIEQLLEMQALICPRLHENLFDQDRAFYALQSARVVKNAEAYYRNLLEGPHSTWNIRDTHMADTLENIMIHHEMIHDTPAKVIVWAHNSHVGDARATEMCDRQEINLGQLARERFNSGVFLLGFSTAEGSVAAASQWDDPPSEVALLPPMKGSYEEIFHSLGIKNFILNLHIDAPATHLLQLSRLQRAIGVVYRPENERMSHYYFSRLPYQFDAIVHIDRSHALRFLEEELKTAHEELPDTYPEGL